jgi:hypothetical protein
MTNSKFAQLKIGYWDLFGIWDLGIGILIRKPFNKGVNP